MWHICRGWKLVPPIFFSPVQSCLKAWSPEPPLTSFPASPVRIGSRCHRGAEGVQEIRGKSSSCLSSGKPDDPLQSDNVNSSLATGGNVGV